jgi:hypothetical protein
LDSFFLYFSLPEDLLNVIPLEKDILEVISRVRVEGYL